MSAGYLRVSPYASQVGSQIVHAAYDNFPAGAHNMTVLLNVARSHGITAWVGENIGGAGNGLTIIQARNAGWISSINMDQLKQSIYNSILSMMYQDNGNNSTGAGGHTTALLNDPSYNPAVSGEHGNAIALNAQGQPVANQYLALTIDNKGQAHFNFISDEGASGAVKNQLAAGAFEPSFTAANGGASSTSVTPSSTAQSSAVSSAAAQSSAASSSAAQSAAASSSVAQSSAISSSTAVQSSAVASAAVSSSATFSSASQSVSVSSAAPTTPAETSSQAQTHPVSVSRAQAPATNNTASSSAALASQPNLASSAIQTTVSNNLNGGNLATDQRKAMGNKVLPRLPK